MQVGVQARRVDHVVQLLTVIYRSLYLSGRQAFGEWGDRLPDFHALNGIRVVVVSNTETDTAHPHPSVWNSGFCKREPYSPVVLRWQADNVGIVRRVCSSRAQLYPVRVPCRGDDLSGMVFRLHIVENQGKPETVLILRECKLQIGRGTVYSIVPGEYSAVPSGLLTGVQLTGAVQHPHIFFQAGIVPAHLLHTVHRLPDSGDGGLCGRCMDGQLCRFRGHNAERKRQLYPAGIGVRIVTGWD